MKTAKYFYFMPFKKRASLYPEDKVIGLQLYPFDKQDIEYIKEAKKRGDQVFTDKNRLINCSGGWNPEYKCWWFEIEMFNQVMRKFLAYLGYELQEINLKE